MRPYALLGVLGCVMLAASFADAATITGIVTGPDGQPFRAAFVQARHDALHRTVSVLSDNQGHYSIPDLPAGDYRVMIRALGYKADAKRGVTLTDEQKTNFDFALQATPIRWSDISIYQGWKLLPNDRGKQTLFDNCMSCHGFQQRMAAVVRDEDGWRDRVTYMREAMRSSLADRQGFSDQQAEDVVFYLNKMFGEPSALPKTPTEVAGYADTVEKFGDEALKIVYVDYDMPGPSRFPWTANPDKDGMLWTPQYGVSNRISELNVATGQIKEFRVPNTGPALIHSAVPAPDGSVWITEAGSKKIGHWDPATQQITEYQDDWRKHTIRLHPDGSIWSTGGLTRFDPKTGTFTHIKDVPSAYGIAIDQQGNVWFTEMKRDGTIGKVDPKTLMVTKYIPPSREKPRRIQVDDDGIVWFCVYDAGKIGRFDPKTETFKEYLLPNPNSKPYALGISRDHKIWYSGEHTDVVGRLDPDTGQIVEFPMPYTDNGMRDFFLDKDGHIWFGTPPNNKVGYFYLADKQRSADSR